MNPVQLPRPEFALCKVGKWALYRLPGGRFIAYRAPFETLRKEGPFKHAPKYIEWPSSAGDIPEVTRTSFDEAMRSWSAGVM